MSYSGKVNFCEEMFDLLIEIEELNEFIPNGIDKKIESLISQIVNYHVKSRL